MFLYTVENQEVVIVVIENISVNAPICAFAVGELRINYPREFDKASKIADITIDTMEWNGTEENFLHSAWRKFVIG